MIDTTKNKMVQKTKAKQGKYNYFKKILDEGEVIYIDTIVMAYKKNHKALLSLLVDSEIENITETGWVLERRISAIADVCEKKLDKDASTNALFFECLKSSNVMLELIKYFKSRSIDYRKFLGKNVK